MNASLWTLCAEDFKDSCDKLDTEKRHVIFDFYQYTYDENAQQAYMLLRQLSVKLVLTSLLKCGTYAKYFCGYSQKITL